MFIIGGGKMARNVVFKADQNGLVLNLNDECDFSVLKQDLQQKFSEGESFFQEDMIIRVNVGNRCLSRQQKGEILELFKELPGVAVVEFTSQQVNFSPSEDKKADTLLIKRTLRSGQTVNFSGNVVLQGDVNPGAEIVAGKDILVLGGIRGTAHAGVNGDKTSTISGFRLNPIQLRIADIISRSPDDLLETPNQPEIAFVQGDQIIIDYLK